MKKKWRPNLDNHVIVWTVQGVDDVRKITQELATLSLLQMSAFSWQIHAYD